MIFASCGGSPAKPTTDIVAQIPWPATEIMAYSLKSNGRETGTGRLSILVNGGRTDLIQQYASGENRDEVTVVVDSKTLKPISSLRRIGTEADPEEKDRLDVTYNEEGATIKQGGKQSGLSVPEHSYDNDSSLFLWRTIDFEDGYSAIYVTIITNRRSRQTIELRIAGKERVTVPAGTFDAWRLEIRGANASQVAWYADSPARTLLKYDNDRGTTWELLTPP